MQDLSKFGGDSEIVQNSDYLGLSQIISDHFGVGFHWGSNPISCPFYPDDVT